MCDDLVLGKPPMLHECLKCGFWCCQKCYYGLQGASESDYVSELVAAIDELIDILEARRPLEEARAARSSVLLKLCEARSSEKTDMDAVSAHSTWESIVLRIQR